jgi:hypothetical protein
VRDRCQTSAVAYFFKQQSHRFTERGIELDGRIERAYPTPRVISLTPTAKPGNRFGDSPAACRNTDTFVNSKEMSMTIKGALAPA